MTTDAEREYQHRAYRRRARKNLNTARQPRKIKIIDERCADPYFISKDQYEEYKAVYARMKGIQVIIDEQA